MAAHLWPSKIGGKTAESHWAAQNWHTFDGFILSGHRMLVGHRKSENFHTPAPGRPTHVCSCSLTHAPGSARPSHHRHLTRAPSATSLAAAYAWQATALARSSPWPMPPGCLPDRRPPALAASLADRCPSPVTSPPDATWPTLGPCTTSPADATHCCLTSPRPLTLLAIA